MKAGYYRVSQRHKRVAVSVGRIPQPAHAAGVIDLVSESIRQSDVHVNLSQQMIVVTEDKVRLRLDCFLRREKKRREWHTPAGMLVTEIAAFVTSSFHGAIGISGDQWQAVFRVLIALTLMWLIYALTKVRRGSSVDSLIDSFKDCQKPVDKSSEEGSLR